MKIKNALLSCMMLLGMSAQAQEAKTVNEFHPHWNVFVQPVGAQYTLGEVSFSDLISYNVQAGAGYQFSPVFGARISLNAWQSKGGWDIGNMQTTWKWNYVAPMVDVTMNLSNVFCGYNPERLFSLGMFLGGGLNIAWGNDDAVDARNSIRDYYGGYYSNENLTYLWEGCNARLTARAGLTGDFRINDKVSVGLELQAFTLNDHYNSKKAGNADWGFNALAGVKINLGKTHTKKVIPPVEPEVRVVEKIVEKVVEKIVEKPVPAPAVEVQKIEPLRRDIFFTISSTHIVEAEMTKVAEIADYLKKHPKATVGITGYADKGTGNVTINKRLSEKRAQIVVDTLVKKYGIDKSRITSASKGDTEQPFAQQELNRVSICIAQ